MRGVLVHGALALLGLVLAYTTWTREDEVEEVVGTQVTIIDCGPEELGKVSLESPTNLIEVNQEKRGDEVLYWVSDLRKPSEPVKAKPTEQADSGVSDAGTDTAKTKQQAAPKSPPKPVRFLAKDAYQQYLKQVAPLRALRGLGVIDEARFSDFGFDKVGTYLRIECKGTTTELEIGSRTYGTARRYVRNPKTGEAYLLDKAITQDLKSARYKFMRTELHDFSFNDVEEAKVSAQGESRTLLHRNRQFPKDAHWVDSEAPDQRNELFSNWFTRVEKLKVRAYLADGAEPGDDLDTAGGPVGEAAPVVEVEYSVGAKPLGKLSLAAATQAGATHYYVRTEGTRNWASVYASAAGQVGEDVLEVVGAKAPAPMQTEAEDAAEPAAPAAPAAPVSPAVAPAPAMPHGGAPRGLPPGHP